MESAKRKMQNSKLLSDPVELRLRRIEGQITGIRKMYGERRGCHELAQQIAAVRAALAGVGKQILSGEAVRCARVPQENNKFIRVVEDFFRFS